MPLVTRPPVRRSTRKVCFTWDHHLIVVFTGHDKREAVKFAILNLSSRLHFKGINEIYVIIYSQAFPNHSFFQVRHSCCFFPCNEREGRPKLMAKHHKSSPSDLYSKHMLIFKFDVAIGCVTWESMTFGIDVKTDLRFKSYSRGKHYELQHSIVILVLFIYHIQVYIFYLF